MRCPKIAVPTRTIVAPSSIAVSRSLLIPIDSSCGATLGSCSAKISCCKRLSSWKQTRTFSVSALKSPIVISPLMCSVGSWATCCTRVRTSSGCAPNLLSSPEVFTCIKMSISRPSAANRVCNFCAKSNLSTDSTQETS